MKFRLLGVVFLIGGLLAGWFWGLGPLREAQAHVPVVKYDKNMFMAVPVAIMIGLTLILGGEEVWDIVNGPPTSKRVWIWRIAGLAIALPIALLSANWFDGQMKALGYGEERSAPFGLDLPPDQPQADPSS